MACFQLTKEEANLPPWRQIIRNGARCNIVPSNINNRQQELQEEPEEYFSDEEIENYDTAKGATLDGVPLLALRNYQKELAQKALKGYNAIICAPTGSGKTRVATHIILEHLKRKDGYPKKVAFLAKTVPLALQQYKSMCKYLPTYRITEMTGQSEDSMSLHMLLPYNDIIVMTPMILENHIKLKLVSSLADFSLLVFDECHHTREGDPYNILMYSYLKIKEKNEQGKLPVIKLPQIVGLTASIGVEKASELENAKKSILKVCGNLDVYNLCTVRNHKEELQNLVPVPDDMQGELVERNEDDSDAKIQEIMENLENDLMHHVKELNSPKITELAGRKSLNRKSQQYVQWAVELTKEVKLVPITERARETNMSVRLAIIIIDYLKAYSVAFETFELVELKDAMAYLRKCLAIYRINERRTTGEDHFYRHFDELYEVVQRRDGDENPNLNILAKTLMEFLVKKKKDSRGIIFVRTRALAEAVASWLNRCEFDDLKNLNASYFTGVNASVAEGGLSPLEQENILQRFREGEVRVLVATSVAEEGLDIPECNLVIKYNHVGNEISTVQTKGRSRAIGGVSILLAMGHILRRENINRMRAKLMAEAIESIQEMASEEIEKHIRDYQHEILEKGRIAEMEEALKKQTFKNTPFKVVCPLCRKVEVESTNMKTIYEKYRVSVDRNLLDHIKVFSDPSMKPQDGLQFLGKVICQGQPEPGRRCGEPLGIIITYQKIPFISLGIKNIRFLKENSGELSGFKQWAKVPYIIDEISGDDIARYIQDGMPRNLSATGRGNSPDSSDDDDDDEDY